MDVDKMQKKLAIWAQDPDFRFDDIYNLLYEENWLRRAYRSVKSNHGSRTAGVDHQTISDFAEDLAENIEALAQSLRRKDFQPQPVRRTYIPKGDGRKRPLGIPTIKDRIVQESLRMVLEPIYETDFSQYSYGFRPNRRTHDAVKAAYTAMNERVKMFWVIDADIKSFFENVDHRRLEQIVQNRIADQQVRDLIWRFLRAGIMEDGTHRHSLLGTPQGGIVSPLLANIYLNELDQWAGRFTDRSKREREKTRKSGKGNWRYVRYADDFLLLTNGGRRTAENMEERLREYLNEDLNLTLSPEKTEIVHANDGFDFLGYHLERQDVGEKKKSVRFTIPKEAKKDYKEKIRTATSGSHDVSVRAKIRALNAVVRGWGNYYRYATDAARRFSELDHFTWRRAMGWLTEKFRSKAAGVVANRLDSTAPITMNGRSLVRLNSVGSAIYRESFKKDGHPYLTEAVGEGEYLPEDDPWLGNAEERLGMEDQRWKALERSDWTCQECGGDLKEVQAEVHHKTPYSRYDNPEEANRLENLMSLCRRCHQEIESSRTLAK